ncbi:MAG TPA: hypothetical protein VFS09_06505 [Candidatus Eisenbacteria bacterium]|nr:hypothetical protein [Candidatus Eisenbacteria bacterium]
MSASITPYYRSEDGSITVYHARMEDVLAAGIVEPRDVALVHADPPYGIKLETRIATVGNRLGRRGLNGGGRGRDYPAIVGDDKPYDPAPLLALDRPLILWGANHYAPRVPASPSWILWDKREDQGSDDNADGEAAWTNLGGPLRIFRHWWRGALRKTEKEHIHLHPSQKPIALCSWVYARAKLKRGDLVFVPYLGSGPDLPAALAMGLRVIACDVEEWCCRTAVAARLNAAPHPEPITTIGPLFGGPR